MPELARGYLVAWRHAAKVPDPLLRGGFGLGADVAWLRRGKGVRRLAANYAKVRPELSPSQLRALTRAGMRSYMRYFREAFTLPALTSEQIDARVRLLGLENIPGVTSGNGAASLALGHVGNWDLAGAYVSAHVAPTITVAEKLQPAELFEEFTSFRRGLGIEVLGLGDAGVFEELVAAAGGHALVALLADRDLTARGVEVDFCGHRARVAAGPAAVALAAGVPLIPTTIHYERLRGVRRRLAGSPWGIVIQMHPAVPVPAADPTLPEAERRRAQVAAMTQAWVAVFATFVREHTADWHMLQRVFVADLDPNWRR